MRPRAAFVSLACASALLAGGPAGAVLLVHEPFDYAAGAVLDATTPASGVNLTGNWIPLGPIVPQKLFFADDVGLDYGSLVGVPTAAANRATQPSGSTAGGASAAIDQDVLVDPGQAIFFSALFRFDDTPNGNRFASINLVDSGSGDHISFGQAVVGSRAIQISAFLADQDLTLRAAADGLVVDEATVLMIGRYFNSSAPLGDTLELIGYDTADADVLPASFDPSDPNAEFSFLVDDLDIDIASFDTVDFLIRSSDNNFSDELRIATSYASLLPTPEPASAALLGLGAAGLAFTARRRRARA